LALEFEWDSRKAAANLAEHKVAFEEAATVFGDPLGRIVGDPRHSSGEKRFVLLGFSERRRLLAVMYAERAGAIRIISARRSTGHERHSYAIVMKKTRSKGNGFRGVHADEILPEYDFSRAARNKYASRYAAGSVVVVLEPDVAAAFPNSTSANEALRAIAAIIQNRARRQASQRRH